MRIYAHILVSKELHEEFKQLSKAEGRTMSGMLMHILSFYKTWRDKC